MLSTCSKPLVVATRGPEQLGNAIARFRVQAALSQSSLAIKAGVRQATVSKAESGVGTTAIETIYALCAALGLEIVLRPRESAKEFRIEDIF